MPKLHLDLFYKLRDRDYDAPRDGYRYIRGDGGDQPRSALTVYNTAHDLTSQTAGFEAAYRLPLRSKLSFEYEFENVVRRNAAVEETDEGRFTVAYRIQPRTDFSARMSLLYGDRAADTYQWDQSYYALLDTELINATPDNQRYINHPELSQYYMANRERLEAKIDLSYLPSQRWNLGLNMQWRDDDYDKSNLGLTGAAWQRIHFSASYVASESLSGSVYAGWDRYESEQSGRAFRGGQEKDAFDIYPPLPQASDPNQNWDLDATDDATTLGANVLWQVAEQFDLRFDYNFVDTQSEQDFKTRPLGTVTASDLPEVETRLHHVKASGIWHLREQLSLQLDYQYYRYSSDDWARQDVNANTIDKVLTFGERNPNEKIHYVGVSAVYRWQ
jgi:MtrB/PioB family decaheme-associated outer membrane protein